VTNRVRYEMVSFLSYNYGADEAPDALQRALKLPPGFNPRTIALAKELRATHGTDERVVQAALRIFNERGYTYTLAPPLLGAHSVDEFMFDTKSGFCEHYSSAFAIVMRAAGIPSRIVTGYLGGELNPIGEYLIVRQADAHAWTEVWLKKQGWVRVDPTAAVAPARIEQGISAAVGASSTLPLFMRSDHPLLRELRLTWDSVANTWNQWVLGYTPERQRALLSRVGLDDATWRTLAVLLLLFTGAITLALALVTLRKLRVRVRDPVKLAYAAFCEKLRARGLPPVPSEGPSTYAERVITARPDLATAVERISRLYVRLRYGRDANVNEVGELQHLARAFKA
jgi:transglutaminase-like putative cysteine protease